MIEKTLAFGKKEDGVSQVLTLEEARALVATCLRFDAYVFIKAHEITIENPTLGCYTDFRGSEEEIAMLSQGLEEKLPPERAYSCWLEHLRECHFMSAAR